MVDNAEIAGLLAAWAEATRRRGGGNARLFPRAEELRAAFHRAMDVLVPGGADVRGLSFCWHSFRHGGASRAFLEGRSLDAIMLRGRWAAQSSARHYIQAGRQMLLSIRQPTEVQALAVRLRRVGQAAILQPDLRGRLS